MDDTKKRGLRIAGRKSQAGRSLRPSPVVSEVQSLNEAASSHLAVYSISKLNFLTIHSSFESLRNRSRPEKFAVAKTVQSKDFQFQRSLNARAFLILKRLPLATSMKSALTFFSLISLFLFLSEASLSESLSISEKRKFLF